MTIAERRTNRISRDEILDLGDYERRRDDVRASAIRARRERRIFLGPNATISFENHETVRYQIQEMLRAERIAKPEEVDHEIETYSDLLPTDSELSATLMIEFPDERERLEKLTALRNIESHLYLSIEGAGNAPAKFDRRQIGEDRLSSVQFIRFPLTPAQRDALRNDAPLRIVCDHTAYPHTADVDAASARAIASDLEDDLYEISDPTYFDPAAIDSELRRVFDVCHGCRMCFNYCPSFPSLFDAIDRHEEKGEGEVAALTAKEIDEVVDLCYQCKLCYVKCPYTPPHKFAIDFPRLLFRAKLATVRKEGVKFRERILGDPDRLGRMSTGPLAQFVNWANRQPFLRALTEKALGIHRKRLLPRFARVTFAKWLARHRQQAADAEPVVLFETCTVNYNRPEVGIAAVQVLEHNGKRIERPDLVCCGMPAMDGGDLETAKAKIAHNVAQLAPLVRRGMKVVALGPSCGMMMKSEWPQLVPTDDCRLVSAATMDIGEYLAKEKAAGRLRTDFTVPQGSVAYHVPCHLRAQNIGAPFKGIFETMPGTKVEAIEQCSAFDGTWGMKTEFYDLSRKCAGKLCKSVERCGANCVASDCLLAGINVTEETGKTPLHPIEIVRNAYGL